ncbi:MAG: hypothetical protein DDT19_02032 [Syntrophomonadaceae bacterium]|nr:hypothetical protein [Bacillota bacterium]
MRGLLPNFFIISSTSNSSCFLCFSNPSRFIKTILRSNCSAVFAHSSASFFAAFVAFSVSSTICNGPLARLSSSDEATIALKLSVILSSAFSICSYNFLSVSFKNVISTPILFNPLSIRANGVTIAAPNARAACFT